MNRQLAIVIALALLVYGWNFWGTSIYILDEAKNAGCAAEMMANDNYAVPVFNNQYHDKPALQYFFMMAAYKAFGVNAFSARLFSVVFGVLTVVALFLFTRSFFNARAALYASLMLICSLQMAVQFRLAVPDPYLLFFLTAGWMAFFTGYARKQKRFLYLFYVCVGAAFLAKGPIAIALPGLTIMIFLLWNRELRWQTLMKLQLLPGVVVAMAVGIPWYIWSGITTGWEWPRYFFFTHNIDRYVNTFEGHGGFPGDVVAILIGALLPMSVFLPQAVRSAWTQKDADPVFKFLMSICIGVLGFFLFSKTVLPSYPAPCVPFAAMLVAAFFADGDLNRFKHAKLHINAVVLLVICTAMPVAGYIALKYDPTLVHLAGHASFFSIATVGAALGFWFLQKEKIGNAVVAWCGSFIVLLIAIFSFTLPKVDAVNPVSRSLDLVKTSPQPLAYYKTINPAFVFALGPVKKLSTPGELEQFVQQHGGATIISTENDWSEISSPCFAQLFSGRDLFETPVTVVYRCDR